MMILLVVVNKGVLVRAVMREDILYDFLCVIT